MTDRELENLIQQNTGEPLRFQNGWFQLVKDLHKELSAAGWDGKFTCAKEKYGHLAFYLENRNPRLETVVEKYMRLSALTCEYCGKPGRTRWMGGWETTVCAAHYLSWSYPLQQEIVNYRGLGPCQICGFLSVLDGECKCCHLPQWKDNQFSAFESATGHIKVYQEEWYSFIKGVSGEVISPLPKSPNHKILCSEKEIEDYEHFTEFDL